MITLIPTLVTAAAAVQPTAELHLLGALGPTDPDAASGIATGGAAGLVVGGPWDLELSLDAGVSGSERLFLVAMPQVRLWLTPRWGRLGALSVTAGGGLWTAPGARPALAPGLAWDLPGSRSFTPRLRVGGLIAPLDGQGAVTLSVGVSGPRPRPEPEPEPVAAPPPPEREPYRWVPHPVSACVLNPQVEAVGSTGEGAQVPQPAADAPTPAAGRALEVAGAAGGSEAETGGDGRSPLPTPPQPLDLASLTRSRGGGLVVVVAPGDEVVVAGHRVPVGTDDTVVIATEAGPQIVDIIGAGRARTIRPVVAEAHATWVRAPSRADPHRVHFAAGSAELSDAERARVEAIAARAGGWRFLLVGGYSPEGSIGVNTRLGRDRAEAVRDALIAAGLPADRIEIAPPEAGDPDTRIEDQRVCRVVPIPPEDSR